jgi:hypothetical protein
MKRAAVLRNRVELAPECTECSAIYRVRMSGANDIRPCGVDGMMNHICSCVKQADLSAIDNCAFGIDENEVRGLNQRKRNAERIHPEMSWFYWILRSVSTNVTHDTIDIEGSVTHPQRDVAGNTFVKAVLAKDSECSSKSSL